MVWHGSSTIILWECFSLAGRVDGIMDGAENRTKLPVSSSHWAEGMQKDPRLGLEPRIVLLHDNSVTNNSNVHPLQKC